MSSAPTPEYLKSLLSYDADTGLLTWLVRRGRMAAGSLAGTTDKDGYTVVRVNKKAYFAHRIIFCMVNGSWPEHQIDHINGDPSDNRLINLRDATASVNAQNIRRACSDNKSTRTLGVSMSGGSNSNPYRAAIHLNGRFIHIGLFPDIESAQEAYLKAKRRLHDGCTI